MFGCAEVTRFPERVFAIKLPTKVALLLATENTFGFPATVIFTFPFNGIFTLELPLIIVEPAETVMPVN